MMHVLALFGWSWNVHLQWDPQIRGFLFVAVAATMLIGSVFLLLSTNVGLRKGFLITACGLFGWLMLLTGVWTIYALKQGPPNPSATEARWVIKEIVTGDVASQSAYKATQSFVHRLTDKGWKVLPKSAKDYADAASATDNVLAPAPPAAGVVPPKPKPPTYTGSSPFSTTDQYIAVDAFAKGGETYWPLNIGVRNVNDPRNRGSVEVNCATTAGLHDKSCHSKSVKQFDCLDGSGSTCIHHPFHWWQRAYYRISKGPLHKPHYVVVQVQPVAPVDLASLPLGAVPPKPVADSSKPITTIVMVRKLGTQRVYPAMWFVSNLIVFLILARLLHISDKQTWARRSAVVTA